MVEEEGGQPAVLVAHPVVGAGEGPRHPPQVEAPRVLDVGHSVPAIADTRRDGLSIRPLPDLDGNVGVDMGLKPSLPRGSTETCTARISGAGCPGATFATRRRTLPASRAGLELPLHLYKLSLPAITNVRQQSHLNS